MSESGLQMTPLPVGAERFHRHAFLNYQFNRAYGLGFAERHDLHDAAAQVRSARDCPAVFDAVSKQAAADGHGRAATSYLRLAEFFTSPAQKSERYRRYRDLFDTAFAGGGLARHHVPYAGASLPAYRLPSAAPWSRGTVLVHGGFDSLIEEFYVIWQRIALAGFDVIAFDGPGQGGARTLEGLTFDHDWEKPVGAVLDHFGLDRPDWSGSPWAATGRSRGRPRTPHRPCRRLAGRVRLAVPAAGRVRSPARMMLRRRRFMRWSVATRARLVPTLRQVVDQTLYIVGSDDPIAVVDWFTTMNANHLGSERVTQDVLLLCGEHDTFQPPSLTRTQAAALTAANSVSVRMFTQAEHADQHCQMGNLDLACRVLTHWLQNPRVIEP